MKSEDRGGATDRAVEGKPQKWMDLNPDVKGLEGFQLIGREVSATQEGAG